MLMLHVRYFGDQGRHSWVFSSCMLEFTNLADFKKEAESAMLDPKKKGAKHVAAFTVKPGIKSKWESAIEEALEVQSMTIEERAKAFAPKVRARKSRSAKTSTPDEKAKSTKRKNSNDQDGPDSKRVKHDSAEKSPRKSEVAKPKNSRIVVNGKNDAKLSFDARSSSPSIHKSQSDNSSNTKVDRNEEEDGVFEIYYERNRDMLEDEYPDASEHDIKKYLRKTWDNMDPAFRKKYRYHMTHGNSEQHSKESSSDHDDEASVGINISAKENKKTKSKVDKDKDKDKDESSVSETKRSRPQNLFKGMKQEKVCQICEKTGKLTRCKGPCYSYFHLSCVKPGESSPEYSVDDNTSDDKIIDDVNVIKRSISGGDDNGKFIITSYYQSQIRVST